VGSCTIQKGKTCFDYPGSAYNPTTVQSSCSRINGTYSADACSAAHRLGSCNIFVGQPTAQTVRYYILGFTASSAQTNCLAQSGAFTAN
jgi:hypothetical protein